MALATTTTSASHSQSSSFIRNTAYGMDAGLQRFDLNRTEGYGPAEHLAPLSTSSMKTGSLSTIESGSIRSDRTITSELSLSSTPSSRSSTPPPPQHYNQRSSSSTARTLYPDSDSEQYAGRKQIVTFADVHQNRQVPPHNRHDMESISRLPDPPSHPRSTGPPRRHKSISPSHERNHRQMGGDNDSSSRGSVASSESGLDVGSLADYDERPVRSFFSGLRDKIQLMSNFLRGNQGRRADESELSFLEREVDRLNVLLKHQHSFNQTLIDQLKKELLTQKAEFETKLKDQKEEIRKLKEENRKLKEEIRKLKEESRKDKEDWKEEIRKLKEETRKLKEESCKDKEDWKEEVRQMKREWAIRETVYGIKLIGLADYKKESDKKFASLEELLKRNIATGAVV
ncbi:hypothetical protein BV898_01853 [Hypsibius exemplaris]|uniref:Uncharacterized protein n=1 Tax=Hypsibius exemplaris TaxID=2072580 RepID=A0A1W0XA91_HYPEX|nr:hypothetical protein BV898_01853 [Hypsibius exemplaris]